MKRYKDLDNKQKRQAVDYMFKRLSGREIYRSSKYILPVNLQKRLKEIKEEIKFCGCMDCFNLFADKANQDSQVKEWILTEAQAAAQEGYYPEEKDNIIKVN